MVGLMRCVSFSFARDDYNALLCCSQQSFDEAHTVSWLSILEGRLNFKK